MTKPTSPVSKEAAADLAQGFEPQQQTPPGYTAQMKPRPDHGEDSYRGSSRLTGMRAVITGGDSGIGRAVAIAFAREGADIAIVYLPDEQEDAEESEQIASEAGAKVVLLPGDIREQSDCQRLIDEAVQGLGGIDILVNNAGFQMGRTAGLGDISAEQLDRVFKTNLYGMFWMTQAVLPHLSEGSSIINVSSIQAYEPSVTLLDYASSKAAINNFTVNLAAELGPKGIRVNAVAPGPIWTPLQPATQPNENLENFGSDTPIGRPGQPAEVAPAFVFLAAPELASYVSGIVLGVTGGKPIF